jgi:hypothetical protein
LIDSTSRIAAVSARGYNPDSNYAEFFILDMSVSAIVAGVSATAIPAAWSASTFPAAVPFPPETIAPA